MSEIDVYRKQAIETVEECKSCQLKRIKRDELKRLIIFKLKVVNHTAGWAGLFWSLFNHYVTKDPTPFTVMLFLGAFSFTLLTFFSVGIVEEKPTKKYDDPT